MSNCDIKYYAVVLNNTFPTTTATTTTQLLVVVVYFSTSRLLATGKSKRQSLLKSQVKIKAMPPLLYGVDQPSFTCTRSQQAEVALLQGNCDTTMKVLPYILTEASNYKGIVTA